MTSKILFPASLLFLLFILLLSCQDEEMAQDDPTPKTISYMPMNIGNEIVYHVNEIIFRNEGTDRDSLSYQLREVVVDRITNDLEETLFFVDRFMRVDTLSAWNYINTWQAHITENQVIRTEDNLSYIKLDLPPQIGKQWDATSFFDESNGLTIGGQSIDYFKGWASTYSKVQGNATISNTDYEDILEVQIANLENLLEIRVAKEIYAANIGLIYREFLIADTQCFSDCADTPWENKGEKGHLYTQRIIN